MDIWELKKALGARCRTLRKARHESQLAFALRIGMDRTEYCAIEHGKRDMKLSNLIKIALGNGITLIDLLDGLPMPSLEDLL